MKNIFLLLFLLLSAINAVEYRPLVLGSDGRQRQLPDGDQMRLMPTYGIEAARPAAAGANIGMLYFATDTKRMFRSTGAGWELFNSNLSDMSGTLSVANGGTGLTGFTTGDLLYASGASALAQLAGVATGNALISGGVSTAPSWGKIGLTTHVSGLLPVANGGTGVGSITLNRVPYGNGTSALQESANLSFDGTTLTTNAITNTGTIDNTASGGIITRQAATQDAIKLLGRAGGSNTRTATLTPATLSASRTITVPDGGGNYTLAGLQIAQTFTQKQTFPAATTSIASINMPHGTAPTTPTNGDMWTTTTGVYAQINGGTVGPFSTGSGGSTVFWGKITNGSINNITTTATALKDRVNYVTGTSADYTITMPSSPASGDSCQFTVGDWSVANKQYTLDAGGTVKIAGRTRYLALTHTNNPFFVYDGAQWIMAGGSLNSPLIDAGAISITSSGTHPTKGTTSIDKLKWSRSGNLFTGIYQYKQTGAGTAGTGTYRIGLPFNYDTALVNRLSEGSAYAEAFGQGQVGIGGLNIIGTNASQGAAYANNANAGVLNFSSVEINGSSVYTWGPNFTLANTTISFGVTVTLPMENW